MLKIYFFLAFFLVSMISSATSSANAIVGPLHFNRVIFVIFENTNYVKAMQQPYFSQLAAEGAHFSGLKGLTHPSQGNYIGLTSGDLQGVKNDNSIDINALNIIDLLEKKGLSWKVYAEDYPGNCFAGDKKNNYVRKHNPFISYNNIRNNPSRCANIVNSQEFGKDAASGDLANYIFYVPNLKDDGHDTGAAVADVWFEKTFSNFISDTKLMKDTILISTFDEDGGSKENHIYTSITGPNIQPGVYSDSLNLYSLLKMVEENWDLGTLGASDQSAPTIPNIWKK